MKGLYFYKLVSPYSEDITKDCKLTINEIDLNFKNLKDADIKEAFADEAKQMITIVRNDGEELKIDLQGVTTNLDVDYDSQDGIISISHNGKEHLIDGLITKDNLSKEILTKVYTDGTLDGLGTPYSPLKLSVNEQTGYLKPAIKIIDTLKGQRLPHKYLIKGDRYITLEESSDYGYLYDYHDVKVINKLLENSGWRVPSKEDWDNMLNAIEPCEHRDHSSQLNHKELGAFAGKLLKSRDNWLTKCDWEETEDENKTIQLTVNEETADIVYEERRKPNKKEFANVGLDAYGMGILPSGYMYDCKDYAHFGMQGAYWTSTELYDTSIYTKVFDNKMNGVLQESECPATKISIRLVKDYDGSNYNEIENIQGKNYKTVLMPSLNTPNEHRIWLAQNLEMCGERLHDVPVLGHSQYTKVYYVNEWNGFKWERKMLNEGDAITILRGERPNDTYKIINGNLTNETDYLTKDITDKVLIEVDIENVKARITATEETLNEHGKHLEELDSNVQKISNNLEIEKQARESGDAELDGKLSEESKLRDIQYQQINALIDEKASNCEEKINELHKSIKDETSDRKQADEEIKGLIKEEAETRESEDLKLYDEIVEETRARRDADNHIMEELEKEIQLQSETDAKQWEAINTNKGNLDNEIERSKNEDKKLEEGLLEESDRAKEVEKELYEKIDSEVNNLQDEIDSLDEKSKELDSSVKELQDQVIEDVTFEDGTIILSKHDDNKTIRLDLDFNFGELEF